MNLEDVVNKVEIENVYQHLLTLEGVRHPIDTPDALNAAGDYIRDQLRSYGVQVREQEFKVEGFDDTFRNIEGSIGNGGPSAVLVAHYDTAPDSPGANDDACGIAVILEVARVLAMENNPPSVIFLGVTLEEENLYPEVTFRNLGKKYDILDDKWRYTSAKISTIMKQFHGIVGNLTFTGGKTRKEAVSFAKSQLKEAMPSNLFDYLTEYEEFWSKYTPDSRMGNTSKIGSTRWVDEAINLNKEISYYICLDEIGTTFTHDHSQMIPDVMLPMLQTYKVDLERKIANFELIMTNSEEKNIIKAFRAHCENELIDLPYAYLNLGMDYEGVVKNFPKALSSDHAPFMRAGIPGIFMFDTSLLRHTFVHSPGDTMDKLDYNLIEKITKAIVATILDPQI